MIPLTKTDCLIQVEDCQTEMAMYVLTMWNFNDF